MKPLTDTDLMAFVDRRLNDAEAAHVEHTIACDSRAHQIVASLQQLSWQIQCAFDRPMHEMPPRRLLDAIDEQFRRLNSRLDEFMSETLDRQWRKWKAQ